MKVQVKELWCDQYFNFIRQSSSSIPQFWWCSVQDKRDATSSCLSSMVQQCCSYGRNQYNVLKFKTLGEQQVFHYFTSYSSYLLLKSLPSFHLESFKFKLEAWKWIWAQLCKWLKTKEEENKKQKTKTKQKNLKLFWTLETRTCRSWHDNKQ